MSTLTPNLNLVLPIGVEKVSRQIINTNMTLIDTAVGGKVNVSDIVNNLTTNDPTKVLSAAQGYALNSKLIWEYVNETSTINEVKTVPAHSSLLIKCIFSDGGIITQELAGDGFFVFDHNDTIVSVNYNQPNATYQISNIAGSLTCIVVLYIKH